MCRKQYNNETDPDSEKYGGIREEWREDVGGLVEGSLGCESTGTLMIGVLSVTHAYIDDS